MLVLTRHVHQSIVIGHDVIVTVLEVRGDQVRLGITAPKDIQVHREEVFAALTAANRQAATSASELEVLKELSPETHGPSQAPARRLEAGGGSGPPPPPRGPGTGGPGTGGPGTGPPARSAAGPASQAADGTSSGTSSPSSSRGAPSTGSGQATSSTAATHQDQS